MGDQDTERLLEAQAEVARLQSVIRQIIDDDHTIINPGGYLVMEAEGYSSEPGTRCVDLTEEEMDAVRRAMESK